MSNLAKNTTKGAGRPKASPESLYLRRIGKNYVLAEELLSAHKSAKSELRASGRGKQPFNNYIKSLQATVAMHLDYLSLLAITSDNAGYDLDTTISISDDDKEQPWLKLKNTYRDNDGKSLSLNAEFSERRKVFGVERAEYMASYPFLDWNAFWLESELNAVKRICEQALNNFEMFGVPALTLNKALKSAEAKKGRTTYKNKQGKNARDELLYQHGDIVRYKNRLRKLLANTGYSDDSFVATNNKIQFVGKTNEENRILKSAHKLQAKIFSMEDELAKCLSKATPAQVANFELAMTKKSRLPLVKKLNSGSISPLEQVKLQTLNNTVYALKSNLKTQEDHLKVA